MFSKIIYLLWITNWGELVTVAFTSETTVTGTIYWQITSLMATHRYWEAIGHFISHILLLSLEHIKNRWKRLPNPPFASVESSRSVHYGIVTSLNSLRRRPNRRHFADDIFKCISENEIEWISPRITLKFVSKVRINNIPAVVQTMAWRRPGDKPLSAPMMVSLLTHICVTRPQWVEHLHAMLTDNRQNKVRKIKCMHLSAKFSLLPLMGCSLMSNKQFSALMQTYHRLNLSASNTLTIELKCKFSIKSVHLTNVAIHMYFCPCFCSLQLSHLTLNTHYADCFTCKLKCLHCLTLKLNNWRYSWVPL